MMLLSYILVFMAIFMHAWAYPLNSTSGMPVERAYPVIQVGVFSPDELKQIYQAHDDAIHLAATVMRWSKYPLGSDASKRFRDAAGKYFATLDFSTVLNVFNMIVYADDGKGHPWLDRLTITTDYKKPDGSNTCDKYLGEFRPDPSGPRIVLCPALFKYPKINDIKCDSLYPRISYKMVTLGHVLLHEYFHFPDVTSPAIIGAPPNGFGIPQIKDYDYGPWKVRRLNRVQSQGNSDSYAWLGTDIFWRETCEGHLGKFGEPEEGDNGPIVVF